MAQAITGAESITVNSAQEIYYVFHDGTGTIDVVITVAGVASTTNFSGDPIQFSAPAGAVITFTLNGGAAGAYGVA